MDPVRLVEATTAGVAFLAAGMIFMSQGKVKNLTTGAMMWLSAAIGLAAGNGLWQIAVLSALIGLVIITLNTWFPGTPRRAITRGRRAPTARRWPSDGRSSETSTPR
jgi:uncharacterized membrane protein YhiD involved in acid resistance